MPFIWIHYHKMISDLPTVCWPGSLSAACPWIPFLIWFQVRADWKWHSTRLGEARSERSWRPSWSVGVRSASSLCIPVLPNGQPFCSMATLGPPLSALLWRHRSGGRDEPMTLPLSPTQRWSWVSVPSRFPANSDSYAKTRAFRQIFSSRFQILPSPISARNLCMKFFIP